MNTVVALLRYFLDLHIDIMSPESSYLNGCHAIAHWDVSDFFIRSGRSSDYRCRNGRYGMAQAS